MLSTARLNAVFWSYMNGCNLFCRSFSRHLGALVLLTQMSIGVIAFSHETTPKWHFVCNNMPFGVISSQINNYLNNKIWAQLSKHFTLTNSCTFIECILHEAITYDKEHMRYMHDFVTIFVIFCLSIKLDYCNVL